MIVAVVASRIEEVSRVHADVEVSSSQREAGSSIADVCEGGEVPRGAGSRPSESR